jgi:hypothetical protein
MLRPPLIPSPVSLSPKEAPASGVFFAENLSAR